MSFKKIFFFALLLILNVCQAADPDSLKKVLSAARHDSARLNACTALGAFYTGKQADSCLKYSKLGMKYCDVKKITRIILLNNCAYSFRIKGLYDSAIAVIHKALTINTTVSATEAERNKYFGILYNELGTSYNFKGDTKRAIESFLNSTASYKQSKVPAGETYPLTNLAILYASRGDNDKALEYFLEIKDIHKRTHDMKALVGDYSNIGAVYDRKKEYGNSLKYYTEALSLMDENTSLQTSAMIYNNIGTAYHMKGDKASAVRSFEDALRIWRESGDKEGECYTLVNIATIYFENGNREKSLETAKRSLSIAREIDSKEDIYTCLRLLVEISEAMNDHKTALGYQKEYTAMKEKDLSNENSKAIAEMKTRFDSDKKEQENIFLQKQNDLSEQTIRQQKIITAIIIIALLIAIGLIFMVFRGFKKQREATFVISRQKKEVELQKHLVEEKQKEVMDSIHYAKRIQSTLLAHSDFLKQHLPVNFVMFKPKDIVSGDFYWATSVRSKELGVRSNSELFYLAVCDSTGHGVPGAFMSLLNIGFLSEAINEKNILKPNEVLDYVRERLINSISKEDQKDGFDGILICIEKGSGYKRVTYAAANNAPVLVSQSSLTELPKDKMPVGKGERKENFSLFSIDYMPGDWLYLYTDGYADQFGGAAGKKFKYKPLNELLLKLSELEPDQQCANLSKEFENWRKDLEQVDDVLVAGLRL